MDIRNLSELLNESPDIVDAPDALDLPTVTKSRGMSLEFRDVWFWYPSQPRYAECLCLDLFTSACRHPPPGFYFYLSVSPFLCLVCVKFCDCCLLADGCRVRGNF